MKNAQMTTAMFALVLAMTAGQWFPNAEAQAPDIDSADRWHMRLVALVPTNPFAYFELAEEMADDPADQTERDLARYLFGLAGALDTPGLGRSASLALADMEDREHVKRRLLALATLLDERGGVAGWGQPAPATQISASAAVAVGEALSHYRRGRGPRALAVLKKPGATALLESVGGVLRGGAKRFIEDCKLYRGQRRPMITDDELHRMLQLEAAVLAGADRAWSGELLLGSGRPLVEVDPDNLQQTLGADASRPYYRRGRWVARDDDQ